MGTLANCEYPDEIQHNAAFHQGLLCLLILNHPPGTQIHNLETFICYALKYKMDNSIPIVSNTQWP